MSDPNGGGFRPPGGAPPGGFHPQAAAPPGGGFGPPPGSPPQGGGFGPPPGPPPPGGGFGAPPPGGFGAPGALPQMEVLPSIEVNIMPAFVLAVITMSGCGCFPLGLAGIYFADQAKKAGFRGDAAGAKSKLLISYALSGVAIACVPIGLALYVLFMVLLQL
ncbi:MAG: hypothetical protein AB8I08_24310 [Sandaracinaceae bacterium]